MKGQDLASTFSFLRPNDLVWNYVVGNYLKGETPPPFDLLYWNSDSTNLPGPFYAWYLRNMYLENNLVKPGKLTVCGEKIDLGKVKLPVYIYGSREDHIVPINAAYASTQVLPGKKRFVMGASGHIAGVINPPAKGKRSHWIRADGKLPKTLDAWLEGARNTRAVGGPTGPAGSRAIPASKLLRPRPMARAASSRPSSPRRAATSSKSPESEHPPMSLRSFPPLSQRSALRAGGRSRRSGAALAREPLSGLRPLHVSWMLRTLNG
jgi:polyhydroxyalkanoate synthase